MKRVEGYGPVGSSRLMIVGIAPGSDEVKSGQPFTGPSGYILRRDLKECGINFDDCYRTNIFKYQLPNNEFKRYEELKLSLTDAISELTNEIQEVKPNVILGLGDPVLYTLAGKSGKGNGIKQWRGSILNVFGRKAIFTYHPAHELHGEGDIASSYKSYEKYIRKFDIKRAVEQSNFPEFRLPTRNLYIASSSSDVNQFFQRNSHKEYCAVDIESIEGIPVCIGLAFSPSEAISIPLWNTLNITCENELKPKQSYSYRLDVSTIPSQDLALIYKLVARFLLDKRYKKIGQNFKYDEDKLIRLGFYLDKLFADIMFLGHSISSELPKNLAFFTSLYTLEPYYKFEGKEFNPKFDKIKDLLLYNAKDAACTIEIYFAQLKDLEEILYGMEHAFDFRMPLHSLYHDIEQVGFKINEDIRKDLIYKYVNWSVKLEKQLWEICSKYEMESLVNMNSPKQVEELLYRVLKIPYRKGTGEEVLTALLANVCKNEDQRNACNIILEYRRVNKTLGNNLSSPTDYDGRFKTSYFVTGTENFRTSTQLVGPPNRPKEMGAAFQLFTKHGDIGSDVRSMLVADRGFVLLNVDQSQAEARVCSLLAEDYETLEMYDTVDIHALTAAKTIGGTMEQYSKKILGYECPERFVGKKGRHSYHLGIGKHMLMIDVNTVCRKYGIQYSISEWKAGKILEALRQMTPKIVDVYHATIQELLISNRRLYGTYGASRYFYDDEGKDLWKGGYSFIPQQTVSDTTKRAALNIKREWKDEIRIILEAHDALLLLVPERKLDDWTPRIREFFEEPIDFSRCSIPRNNLVIPADFEVGYDYQSLEKYKVKR
jgi:uracil-DNA glycosylase family 4